MKRIKQTPVLRKKKTFQNVRNSGELLLIQEIGSTVGNSGDSRKNRDTLTICVYLTMLHDVNIILYQELIYRIAFYLKAHLQNQFFYDFYQKKCVCLTKLSPALTKVTQNQKMKCSGKKCQGIVNKKNISSESLLFCAIILKFMSSTVLILVT